MHRYVIPLVLVLSVGAPAHAWWAKGHERATRMAVAAAGDKLPAFFAAGVGHIVKTAPEPDLLRDPTTPQLRDQEYSQHFTDIELLGGAKLPATRSAFVALCAKKGIAPSKVGTVPYKVAEYTQRLTIFFAEHRKLPDDPIIRARCLVFAGLLAHYAQDMCQPLHTTVHYDGRAKANGASPRSGIHAKMDALLAVAPKDTAVDPASIRVLSPLMDAVIAELMRSHALVDKVYEIEGALPKPEESPGADSPAGRLASERLRAAAAFTASLYLTAWEDSAKIELPAFYGK